jgi:hypothetical protein
VETAEPESRGSPFPMPAGLADGLDQESDLKTIAWPSSPRSVPWRNGFPAPVRRKADRLGLQYALDRHAETMVQKVPRDKLRMTGKALRKC